MCWLFARSCSGILTFSQDAEFSLLTPPALQRFASC
jgi:hypothetical protein